MTFLYAIVMGLLQGITEFLPVSSSGHLAVAQHLFGIEEYTGLPLSAFLHLGSLIAIVLAYWTDLFRIFSEVIGMGFDIYQNFLTYTGSGDRQRGYRTILHNNYRRMAVLLAVTAIPTLLLGFLSRNLALAAGDSLTVTGMGFLITGLFLLVVDFVRPGYKIPRDMGFDCAMWVGICLGLSVFAGISSLGLALAAGMLNGLKKSFAVKYAMLASIPALLGAFAVEVSSLGRGDLDVGMFFCFFAGALAAAVVGAFAIHGFLRFVQRRHCRIFAYYCFAIGLASFAIQFL